MDCSDKDVVTKTFYKNVTLILKKRGIRWADLALLINMAPSSLSSMKSSLINPGLFTAKLIADALEVSLEELVNDGCSSLNDLEWLVKNLFPNNQTQELISNQLTKNLQLLATFITELNPQQKLLIDIEKSRDEICKEKIQNKLKKITTL